MHPVLAILVALLGLLAPPAANPVVGTKAELRLPPAHAAIQAVLESRGSAAVPRSSSRPAGPAIVEPVGFPPARAGWTVVVGPLAADRTAADRPACGGPTDQRAVVRRHRVAAHVPRLGDDDPPRA